MSGVEPVELDIALELGIVRTEIEWDNLPDKSRPTRSDSYMVELRISTLHLNSLNVNPIVLDELVQDSAKLNAVGEFAERGFEDQLFILSFIVRKTLYDSFLYVMAGVLKEAGISKYEVSKSDYLGLDSVC